LRNWELGIKGLGIEELGIGNWELGIGVTIELKRLNKFNLPKKFVNSWLTKNSKSPLGD